VICLLLTLANISAKIVYMIFFSYQHRLREGIVELDYSANQARQNKSQAESEIKHKKFSLMKCKER